MSIFANTFSPEGAVAAIMYLAKNASNNMYEVLKMLYVADKRHLDDTGRFMFGDTYYALPQGATPSFTYDLVKFTRGDGNSHFGFPEATEFFVVADNEIRLLQDVPEDFLSESTRAHLDGVIEEHKEKGSKQRYYWYRAAHDEAYSSVWDEDSPEDAVKITQQDIAEKSLKNDALLQYLND